MNDPPIVATANYGNVEVARLLKKYMFLSKDSLQLAIERAIKGNHSETCKFFLENFEHLSLN